MPLTFRITVIMIDWIVTKIPALKTLMEQNTYMLRYPEARNRKETEGGLCRQTIVFET